MTIQTTHSENRFNGDGITKSFNFTFAVSAKEPGVNVFVDNVMQTSGISILPNANQSEAPGGTCLFVTAPADGSLVELKRNTRQTQDVAFPLDAKLDTQKLTLQLDKQVLMLQEARRDLARHTFYWRGQWSAANTYQPGEAVVNDGSAYIALSVNTNSEPPSADWDLLVPRGEQGPPGTGNMDGPSTSHNNAMAVFNGTDGQNVKEGLDPNGQNGKVVGVAGNVFAYVNGVVSPTTVVDKAIPIYDGTDGRKVGAGIAPVGEGKFLKVQGGNWALGDGAAKIASIVPCTYAEYTGGVMLAVMTSDGKLKVGGSNAYLPRGSTDGNSRFGDVIFDQSVAAIPAGTTILKASLSGAHMAVVLSNNWVYTAGSNTTGQLGHGDTTTRYLLKRVEYFVTNNISIRDVVCTVDGAGGDANGSTFFISTTEKLYATGMAARGRLGNGGTTSITTPTQVFDAGALGTTIAEVVHNLAHASFMRLGNGDMYSTGGNSNGELGVGDTTDRTTWTKITGISGVAKILTSGSSYSTYQSSTFALTTAGNLHCWGSNSNGQLGTGNTTQKNAPGTASLTDVVDFMVGAGSYTSNVHAKKSNNDLYSWGVGGGGCLFSGATADVLTPTKFFPGKVAKMFAWRAAWQYSHINGAPLIIDTAGRWHTSSSAPADFPFPVVTNPAITNTYIIPIPKELIDGTDAVETVVPRCYGNNVMAAFIKTVGGTLYGCGVGAAKPPALGYVSSGDPTNAYWVRMNQYMGAA